MKARESLVLQLNLAVALNNKNLMFLKMKGKPMLKKTLISLIFFTFISNNSLLFSKDIPIIVIAPSKKPQSSSTVGTSVVVLDKEF